MPRLCPHCHKLGISRWASMASSRAPVECSICHKLSRRKPDPLVRWSMMIVALWVLISVPILHLPDSIVLGIIVILIIMLLQFSYQRARFDPLDLDAHT